MPPGALAGSSPPARLARSGSNRRRALAPGGSASGRARRPPAARPAGGGGGVSVSAKLVSALRSDASSYRWVAATSGSQSAASLELASGQAVMAIGGFSNEGGRLSLAAFERYVARGEIHYYVASQAGGGGGPGGGGTSSTIASWVKANFKAVSIGGTTVYDLTAHVSSDSAISQLAQHASTSIDLRMKPMNTNTLHIHSSSTLHLDGAPAAARIRPSRS